MCQIKGCLQETDSELYSKEVQNLKSRIEGVVKGALGDQFRIGIGLENISELNR